MDVNFSRMILVILHYVLISSNCYWLDRAVLLEHFDIVNELLNGFDDIDVLDVLFNFYLKVLEEWVW